MRITNSIIQRQSLSAIQHNLNLMQEAQDRVTSGKRINRPSDDPAGTVGVMNADGRLRALDQYARNIGGAQSRMAAEEGVLDQVTDILTRARELAVSSAGANSDTASRAIAKAEVDQLAQAVIGLGNTRFGGSYLFGGDYAQDAPFTATGATSTTRPPSGVRQVQIDEGQSVFLNHDALEVFVDSGAIASLQQLSTALGNDSGPDIQAAIVPLNDAFDAVQRLIGETGARTNQLEMAKANVESLQVNLKAFRSDLSEVDLEEAVSQLVNRQTSYQSALMSTSRMISMTLTDYLR